MPFPILGVDSDTSLINHHLLHWCEHRQITFTRSRRQLQRRRPRGQKNWAVVRTVVGYHRYDTAAELALFNQIWVLQSQLTTTSPRSRSSSPRSVREPRSP